MPVADVIRQVGIAEQTFYRWKRQYTRNAYRGGQRPAMRALMRSIDRLLDAHSEILGH